MAMWNEEYEQILKLYVWCTSLCEITCMHRIRCETLFKYIPPSSHALHLIEQIEANNNTYWHILFTYKNLYNQITPLTVVLNNQGLKIKNYYCAVIYWCQMMLFHFFSLSVLLCDPFVVLHICSYDHVTLLADAIRLLSVEKSTIPRWKFIMIWNLHLHLHVWK